MAGLVFVAASSGGSVASGDLTRIRSHCMRGRNKRIDSRRSRREVRRKIKEARCCAVPPPAPPPTTTPTTPSSEVGRPSPIDFERRFSNVVSVLSRIPPPPPPDVALVRFAGELKPSSLESIDQFMRFSKIKNTLYPIHQCVDFDRHMTDHVPWLFSDAVFFHTTLMGVFSMKCVMYNQTPSDTMYFHHRQALNLLNERLSSPEALEWESTVWVIQSLALMCGLLNDFSATHTHLKGLKQIVALKGGFKFLRERPKLHFKAENLDLLSCLRSGNSPTFLVEPASWEPIFNTRMDGWDQFTRLDHTAFDSRLIATYNDLQQFSVLIHGVLEKGERLDAMLFQSMLHSIQSRLVHLKENLLYGPSLCVCLGMLAFATTVFSFPGKRVTYTHLCSLFSQALRRVERAQSISTGLILWLSVVHAMMTVEPSNSDTNNLLRALNKPVIGWPQARKVLLSVMWIGPLQDESGKESFSKLMLPKN